MLQNNQNSIQQHSLLSFPDITTCPLASDWSLELAADWLPYFLEQSQQSVCQEIKRKLDPYIQFIEQKSWTSAFREHLNLKGLAFTLAFVPEDKKVLVASAKLSYELFLIKSYQKEKVVKNFDEKQRAAWKKFTTHTEKMAAMNPHHFPSVIEKVTFFQHLTCPFSDPLWSEIEEESQQELEKLLTNINRYRTSFFEKISDFALALAAHYALIRIHMLKFLAVLPSLDHDKKGDQVKRILLESIRRLLEDNRKAKDLKKKGDQRALPGVTLWSFKMSGYLFKLLPAKLLSFIVRLSVKKMAQRFIAGESIEKASAAFKSLAKTGRDMTIDQLGELVVSEKEADHYMNEILKLIDGIEQHVRPGDRNRAGILKAHISIKVSALCSHFKPEAFEYTYSHVAPRLQKILLTAKEKSVHINIDAEHYHYRDVVFEVFQRVLQETESLHDYADTGIVIQAYLRDGAAHLKEISRLAKERKLVMPVRLVKGAYWDAETIEADAHGHIAPQFLNKEETDIHFRQLILEILRDENLQLCLASHNFSDHIFARMARQKFFPTAHEIEHQCLHMTYEALSTAMGQMGWAVRNYVPVGSLLVGMAYLVRRIMENSSQVGVLTIMRSHKKQARMMTPQQVYLEIRELGAQKFDPLVAQVSDEFENLTPARHYLKDEFLLAQKAYQDFRDHHLGHFYDNPFLDQRHSNSKLHQVFCSSDPKLLVGETRFATAEDATAAVETCLQSFHHKNFSRSSWAQRSAIILKAAQLMMAQRAELSALISYEAGKSLAEAYGDVDEAVDFLNFYGRQNQKVHQFDSSITARGVVAVIAPWNFPLAISCGMTCASLLAGNSTILKSAEQTPLVAARLCQILWQAGIDRDILIHLPGLGHQVGQALVDDTRLAGYIFTGSKDVGMMIAKHASHRLIENKNEKTFYPVKVITEMGGKNAIIVTANAELDETVAGILYSSFAHAGQKCSAASRIIVEESLRESLIERLKEAVADLEVTTAWDFSCAVNPVISQQDYQRLKSQIKQAAQEVESFGGQVIIDRSDEQLPGYCVGPAVFEVSADRALDPESFAQKELFGPVVHIISVKDLKQAIEVFNSTPYALTGGVFSQSQDDIDWLSERMECGNLYINRSITGARVAIEPFGGFKLSGTGPKAGSRHYLSALYVRPFDGEVFGDLGPDSEVAGSDYDFDLARPNSQPATMRISRLIKVVDQLISQFESFYQGIYLNEKETLIQFRKWISQNFMEFYHKRHWNRRIPGQLSYNNIEMSPEYCFVVCFEKRPYFSTLMQVLSALAMGVGVTIACRTQQSYHWWLQFKSLLLRSGLSKENVDVYLCSDHILQKSLQAPMISTVIIDGRRDQIEKVFSYSQKYGQDFLRPRLFLSAFDGPSNDDFKRLCLHFSWSRSFAINTVRHGAPLELQLEKEV